MIAKLVAFALRMPFIVCSCAVLLVIAGLEAYRELDIEAYPNPVPPMVEIITQPDGWSAEEVERYVTVPLEIGLAGMPGLDHTRSQSLFGLSDVKCYFTWSNKYSDVKQEVINRLQFISLPSGTQAQLSPWNAIGELFRYTVTGKGYTTRDLKTAEDWVLERQFKQVPGVIDVVSFGGETKQYQVAVDPFRLRGQSVALSQIVGGIQAANQNVGGQRLTIGAQSYAVRGIGLLRDLHDINDVVVALPKDVPIRIKDVADTQIGYAPRLGIVGHDDDPDVVQGVVLMRYGGETPKTLAGIHDRIDYIRKYHVLPPGMDIVPYYDRGNLVKLTTHTVLENLITGMLLVSVVLFLFLGHLRAALITAINIPLALLFAFSGLVGSGTPANLISLGAVDFGIVVDSTVIMMENIFRHLGAHGKGDMRERILMGASEVAGPMTFSTFIIGVAFLPLFTMTGVAGVIFAPMATTYAFAIGGAILLALTLTPVLASKFVPEQTEEKEPPIMRALHRAYTPLFRAAMKWPGRVLAIGIIPVLVGVCAFPWLGGEFMPKLEEGNFWIRATLPTSNLARGVGAVRREHAAHLARLPARGVRPVRRGDAHQQGSVDGHLPARSPGRRDGRGRLLQHRALRPPRPLRRVAARAHQGRADRSALQGALGRLPRRRLQLLPDDQRQRRGGRQRRQRRELGEGLRARSRGEREERERHRRHDVRGQGGEGLGDVPLPRAAQRQDRPRPCELRSVWSEHRRRGRRHPGGDRRAGCHPGLRRGEALRSDGALARAVSKLDRVDP